MISWLLLPITVVQNPAWRMPCFSQIRSVSFALARSNLHPRPLEHSPAAGESEVEILQHQALGLVSGHRDPNRISTGRLG